RLVHWPPGLVEQRLERRIGRARRRELHVHGDAAYRRAAAHEHYLEARGAQRLRERGGALQVPDAEQVLDIEEDFHRRFNASTAGAPPAPSRKRCTAYQSSFAGGAPRRFQPVAAA